jgi:hypothetical protein
MTHKELVWLAMIPQLLCAIEVIKADEGEIDLGHAVALAARAPALAKKD